MIPFVQFWERYPVKKDKPVAERAFNRLKLDQCVDVVLWALDREIAERKQAKAHERWKPEWKYPSTWIKALDIHEAKRGMLEEQQARMFSEDSTEGDQATLDVIRERHAEKVRAARKPLPKAEPAQEVTPTFREDALAAVDAIRKAKRKP